MSMPMSFVEHEVRRCPGTARFKERSFYGDFIAYKSL